MSRANAAAEKTAIAMGHRSGEGSQTRYVAIDAISPMKHSKVPTATLTIPNLVGEYVISHNYTITTLAILGSNTPLRGGRLPPTPSLIVPLSPAKSRWCDPIFFRRTVKSGAPTRPASFHYAATSLRPDHAALRRVSGLRPGTHESTAIGQWTSPNRS